MTVSSVGFMGSAVQIGFNTKVAPTVYTNLGEVLDIEPSDPSVKSVQITNNNSPKDANGIIWDEFIAATADGGQCTFKVVYNPADAVVLQGKLGVPVGAKVQFPILGAQVTTGDSFTFDCFIEKMKISGNLENAVEYDVTLKVTGIPTFTPGA